jgi:hypothetical protein
MGDACPIVTPRHAWSLLAAERPWVAKSLTSDAKSGIIIRIERIAVCPPTLTSFLHGKFPSGHSVFLKGGQS